MTTGEQERQHWDGLASDLSNVGGGDTMPPPGHFIQFLARGWRDTQADGDLLDLGCGPGRLAVPVSERLRRRVWAVDVSPNMLAQINPAAELVWPVLGDGRAIPDAVQNIAMAWSVLMFQHVGLDVQIAYTAQVRNRLLPGGVFVAQVVTFGPVHDFSHPVAAWQAVAYGEMAGMDLVWAQRDPVVREWTWLAWRKP